MVALFMTFGLATAQTVERPGVFSNMYVGLSAGVHSGSITYPIVDFQNFNGMKSLGYNATLELGKNVTPITGFSLKGAVMPDFTNGFDLRYMEITGNTKFNLMNLFGGYNDQPRVFEIQTVTGIGAEHRFQAMVGSNPWDISLNAGLEFDFNLGKERAWYITFTPEVVAHEILYKSQQIQDMAEVADIRANIGIAYRFGSNKTHSHNFVICPYTHTEEEYEEICNMYDECMNKPAEIDTVVIEKIVKIETETIVPADKAEEAIVTFEKNSSKLSAAEMARLNMFMANVEKDAKITVVGSADSKTGSEKYNYALATLRAEEVKNILEQNGYTNVTTDTKLDVSETPEFSRCAVVICK